MSELPGLSVYRDPTAYAAIPAVAYDERSPQVMEAIQSKGFYTHEIADGLHYATEGWYFMLVVEHDDGVIVVDAPPTIGQDFLGGNILSAVREVSDKPVTHVIYSHHHRDHIGAATVYPDDVTIIAQRECAAYVESANDPQRPAPTVVFGDSYTLGRRADAATGLPREHPLPGQHLHLRAGAAGADERRRRLPRMGSVQQPGDGV
jgi:glyoxylase-like metal-dependent hydrolase (beta-lactamase superfamily II)